MKFERNPMLLKEDSQFLEDIGGQYENYSYLEVGVYYGQSLPYQLVREECSKVMGVDLFPKTYPDERHFVHKKQPNWEQVFTYLDDRDVPREKLEHFHGDVADLPVEYQYDIAFIDAEHTNEAAFRDALNVMPHMKDDCLIIFHDTTLVFGAIDCFRVWLDSQSIKWNMFKIRGSELTVFVLGNMTEMEKFCRKRKQNYERFKMNAKLRLAFNIISKNSPDPAKYFDRYD